MRVVEKIKNNHYIKGDSTDLSYSLSVQLPFFSCKNLFLNNNFQRDIEKYMYCKEYNIHPYKGSYGEQPKLWIEKTFTIKRALSVKKYYDELKSQKQAKRGITNG